MSDILPRTPTRGHTSMGGPANIYIQLFWADIGCHLEDLASVMAKKGQIVK